MSLRSPAGSVIDVYETKNKEIVKQVHFTVVVCSDADTCKQARQSLRLAQQLQQRVEDR